MKKNTLLLFVFIYALSLNSKAQTPDWLWAKSALGMNSDVVNSISVDTSGNTYITGYFFSDTLIFGSTTLINTGGGHSDIFIAKYNSDGNVLWAKSAVGSGWEEVKSVVVDLSGNIYVTGFFSGPSFTIGSNYLTNMSTNGYEEIFVAKYDNNGNVIWAKSASGSFGDGAFSIIVDAVGNAYIAGYFSSYTLGFGTITLHNYGISSHAIFLAKYDVNGNVIWAKREGGADNNYGQATSLAIDTTGNIYMAGMFNSPTLCFDADTLTNTGSYDIFVAKFNNNGDVIWAKGVSGSGWDQANSLALDRSGNTYITGWFDGTSLAFDSINLLNTGNIDVFLVKYDDNGNAIWAKGAEGTSWDYSMSVALDKAGNPYFAGLFYSDTLIIGSTILTKVYGYGSTNDIFLAKYDTNGNPIWAKSIGGSDREEANSITVDETGNIFLAGYFSSSVLNFSIDTLLNVNNGSPAIFVAKLGINVIIGLNEFDNSLNISVYPNPVKDKITIIIPEKATIEILDLKGQIIKTIIYYSGETSVSLEGLCSGVYILRAKTDKEIITKKFIKE